MENQQTTEARFAARFAALFDGLKRAYGTYALSGDTDERGKAGGTAVTKSAPVTLELYAQHLQGKQSLGIAPIRDDNTCVFGVIDVDIYDELDHTAIAVGLQSQVIPLLPCRSKSGGCHLYLFAKEPVAASLMRAKLKDIAASIGHAQAEIFPKQSKILPTEKGSWINLPLFNGDAGDRYAVKPDGARYTLVEFLDKAAELAVGPEFFSPAGTTGRKPQNADPLPGGPPCLNHLVRIGMPEGGRNEFMHNVAKYAKRANPGGWRDDVEKYNRGCCNPSLPYDEIGTIIESIGKKDYQYSCSRAPLASHCNRGVCRNRKFGVGNNGETPPEYGTLTKYGDVPPVQWVWEVDGVRLPLSTSQLSDYRQFQKACMEHLTKIIPDMKQSEWKQHLAKAFETVHYEPVSEDASDQGQLWILLEKFCTGRVQAQSLAEISAGKPFTEGDRTYFLLHDFLKFLHRNQFHELNIQQIGAVLKERGAVSKKQRIKGHGSRHVWDIPKFAGYSDEPFPIPESITSSQQPF